MSISGNRVPIDVRDINGKKEVTFRIGFANTDTGAFDIVVSDLTKMEYARASSEVQAQNGGRVLSAVPKTGFPNTVTLSIHNGGAAQAPTSVLLTCVGI